MRKLQSKTTSLFRRNQSIYLRFRLPIEFSNQFGITEFKRSLGDISLQQASLIAAKMKMELGRVYKMAVQKELNMEDVSHLIHLVFLKISKEVELGYNPNTSDLDLELAEQKDIAEYEIANWLDELDTPETSKMFVTKGNALLEELGISASEIPPHLLNHFYKGVVRAHIEQQRMFISKLKNRFAPYEPKDDLFRGIEHLKDQIPVRSFKSPTKPPYAPQIAPFSSPKSQMLLSEVYKKYADTKKESQEFEGEKEKRSCFAKFLMVIDGDRPINEITKEDIISYRDTLAHFKRRTIFSKIKSIEDLLTNDPDKIISPPTAIKYLGLIRTFFKWAYQENYISHDPSDIANIIVPKSYKSEIPRRAFTKEELTALFSTPIFQGCMGTGTKARFLAGDYIVQDDRYWVPIVCYYTGARVSEIIQLEYEDLVLDTETPHFIITLETAHPKLSTKSLKNKTAKRIIPIHPDLIKLGFAKYVEKQRKTSPKNEIRLFSMVPIKSNSSKAGDVFSKRFATILKKYDIKAPDISLHSFRHNMNQSFQNSPNDKKITTRIMGHTIDDMTGHYDNTLWPKTAYDAILKVEFLIDLPALLKNKP